MSDTLLVAILIPLCTAIISLCSSIYIDNARHARLQADLAILEQARKINAHRISPLLPDFEERVARQVHTLTTSDSKWTNAVMAIICLAFAVASFAAAGMIIGINDGNNQPTSITTLIVGEIVALMLGIASTVLCIENARSYLSFRAYSEYLLAKINQVPAVVDEVERDVVEYAQLEAMIKAYLERTIDSVDELSRSFGRGSYDKSGLIVFYPRRTIASLEKKELETFDLLATINHTTQKISDTVALLNDAERQSSYLSERTLFKKRVPHDMDAAAVQIGKLREMQRQVDRLELDASRALRYIRSTLGMLRDAEARGDFDDQVVIEERGLMLVTDKKAVVKYKLDHFFSSGDHGSLRVVRSHDGDRAALLIAPEDNSRGTVVGFICPKDWNEDLDSVLGVHVPTVSMVHADRSR